MALVRPQYKVAVVQAAPAWLDLDACVDRTIALIDEAAANGAGLIASPATWRPGDPRHVWIGAHARRVSCGFVQRQFDDFLDCDSAEARRLAAAVRKAGITA